MNIWNYEHQSRHIAVWNYLLLISFVSWYYQTVIHVLCIHRWQMLRHETKQVNFKIIFNITTKNNNNCKPIYWNSKSKHMSAVYNLFLRLSMSVLRDKHANSYGFIGLRRDHWHIVDTERRILYFILYKIGTDLSIVEYIFCPV